MNGMMGYGSMGYGMGYGYMFLGLIFWILIIIGVILLIKWFIDQSKTTSAEKSSSALEILQIRYAKGEITRHEYLQAKDDIKKMS